MPIYVYRCNEGHQIPVKQSMVEEPLDKCPQCGVSCRRVIQTTNVVYKGSGFYTKDKKIGRNGANNDTPRKHG